MAKSLFTPGNKTHEARLGELFEELAVRTAEHLECFHYLSNIDGTFECLDYGISGKTEQEVDEAVLAYCSSHSTTDILPASPRDHWLRMAFGQIASYRKITNWPLKRNVLVATCREAT